MGLEVASVVAGAGTALAGLILVYIGALQAAFKSYSATARNTVKNSYQARAWIGFGGFVLALASAAFSCLAIWGNYEGLADLGFLLLGCSFLAAIAITLMSVLEIN